MPVGAIAGAVVGGVASSAIGAHAQSKAAKQAADTSLEAAKENNALYREIYGKNTALLSPYSNNGLLASNALNDLLLGTNTYNPSAPTPATPATPALPSTGGGGVTVTPNGSVMDGGETPGLQPGHHFIGDRSRLLARLGAPTSPVQTIPTGTAPPPVPVTPTTGTTAPGSALDAFARFRQGTNYQWRLGQGQNALESQWAANGAFDSGAERKAALEYGQNFASNELSNYMNLLAGQQAMGLSAAGAVAGVGTTYAGNVAAQNTNAANTAANAALARGQATSNLWGSIGQGIGTLGGALYQYKGGF